MKENKCIEIDVNGSSIILENFRHSLKPENLSQIIFFGFSRENNSELLICHNKEIDSFLLKLISYFDEEHIRYKLSLLCEEHIKKIESDTEFFEIKKRKAINFKNGRFKNREFQEFLLFVKNSIIRKLKVHQLKSAFHLYLLGSAANFSVPGSGKTSVVLTVYEKLKNEGTVNKILVVGPSSCFGPWKQEFELTLGKKPKYKILAGGEPLSRKNEYFNDSSDSCELYLITYQTLLNDRNELKNFFNRKGIRVFFIIDEAHYIKQIAGNWATAVLSLSRHCAYKCVLTGTPFPRSYSDVFNIFDFLYGEHSPLSQETKTRIKLLEESQKESTAQEILRECIGPFFYRVRKADLGLKRQRFNPPCLIKMNNYESIIYDAIEKKIRNYDKEDYLKNIDLVMRLRRGRIMRLRQSASYVKLLLRSIEGYREDLVKNENDLSRIISNYDSLEKPAKLIFLGGLIKKIRINNKKIIVWANFVETLKLIKKYLIQKGFMCELIYGDTPTEQTSISDALTREKIINKFKDKNSNLDILILNPAACAESISLHKTCFHAIYYDLSYNCAQYLQSLDRIHRVGGSEVNLANYYFLQYRNTIEQDIKENLDKKAKKMERLIEQDYSIYSLDMFEEDEEVAAYERLFTRS